jgi:hypothetical protein
MVEMHQKHMHFLFLKNIKGKKLGYDKYYHILFL